MHILNQSLKNRAVRRGKIIEGQMKALIKAIDSEKYCMDLITQSLAVQKSLQSLNQLLLENHLKSHVKDQMSSGKNTEKAVQELVRIYSLSNK